jgi:hypothetical protein
MGRRFSWDMKATARSAIPRKEFAFTHQGRLYSSAVGAADVSPARQGWDAKVEAQGFIPAK